MILWQIALLVGIGVMLAALIFVAAVLFVETHISTVVNCTIARLSADVEMEEWHKRDKHES